DPPTFLVRQDGKPALGLGVSMQDGANIITLGENLKHTMAGIVAELPVGIEVTQIANQPHIVEDSVSEFVSPSALRNRARANTPAAFSGSSGLRSSRPGSSRFCSRRISA